MSAALLPANATRHQLGELSRAIELSLVNESLAAFAKGAWPVLEPAQPLKWGWALDAICEHLEAVTDGQITHLLMNVPPGCMKSLLTGVLWPAWEWTLHRYEKNDKGAEQRVYTHRSMRYLGTAHKQELALRDNLKCRRLIQSRWYQERWPLVLTGDQNAKSKFENDATGFREAMAFKSMTGSRGDRVILDDPLSADQANSPAELAAAATTFQEALPTRVNNEKSAIVVIMQRLHEGDTSGIILDKALGYTHLMLPMRFEPERRCATSIGFKDPRTKDQELLFPDRFPEKQVKALERVLGEYATAGQLQQRPTPRGGGMFKQKHLRLWPASVALPDFLYIVQSYDTAFTEDTANDPTACGVYGVFRVPATSKQPAYNAVMLLENWDDHLEYPEVRRKILKDWVAEYGGRKGDILHPPRRADAVLIEDKGSGISLRQDLQRAKVPIIPYNPGKADKYARASIVQPMYELGMLYVLESSKKGEAGKPITWARPFTTQLHKFGPGVVTHDDYVDTFTQAMIYLRNQGLIALPEVPDDEEEDRDYSGKKRTNPYD